MNTWYYAYAANVKYNNFLQIWVIQSTFVGKTIFFTIDEFVCTIPTDMHNDNKHGHNLNKIEIFNADGQIQFEDAFTAN